MIPRIPPKYRPRGIQFLYEDADVIVVCKEPGILTTETRHHESFTVENAVTNYLQKGCARSSKHAYLVHRLDRETSGVLLFAKSEEAQERIKDHWHENEKIYIALVHGTMKDEKGSFESYLAEDEDLYVRSVRNPEEGKLSRTEYSVLAAARGITAVRIHLLTGRKNQIRVQFADAGYPVVGDEKYGRDSQRESRLFLHAKSISFNQPFTGKRLTFDTPIPPAFSKRIGIARFL